MSYLKNKKIIVGVTAGAAIYKSLDLIRRIKDQGAEVFPVMTRSATKLISPQMFSAMAGRKAMTKMFAGDVDPMEHIRLQNVDAIVVAPATANFISKAANGIADDLLTTTVLASKGRLLVAPAMNDEMWYKPQIKMNVVKLMGTSTEFVGPGFGGLACGTQGYGRMAEVDEILAYLERVLAPKDLKGKKVLVTAGPTREDWDDIRFISNRSSGRQGYAIAKEAWLRGAEVQLVSGPVALDEPYDVEMTKIESAQDMFEAVRERFSHIDYFVSAAAVGDFKPDKFLGKIPKRGLLPSMTLQANLDILKWCADNKAGQKMIGFALEEGDLEAKARAKMQEKKCDFMVGNLFTVMGEAESECLVIGDNGKITISGQKSDIAKALWDFVV